MTTTRSLSPAGAELLLRLSGRGKSIFSVAEAQAITGKSYRATVALLWRLVRKGWLIRLKPGKYLIVPLEAGPDGIPMADRYVIAREILAPLPYYISHYSALELHQMTTQPVNVVYAAVPRQQPNRNVAGFSYRFVYTGPTSFWGWEETWVTEQERVRVSDLEKTILDCAVRPQLCGGISELAKGIWLRKDDLRVDRLVSYILRLGHKAAAKRLGFLLELYDLAQPDFLAPLRPLITKRYAPLDPTLPDEGPHRARWRLRLNLAPEELKNIVWT